MNVLLQKCNKRMWRKQKSSMFFCTEWRNLKQTNYTHHLWTLLVVFLTLLHVNHLLELLLHLYFHFVLVGGGVFLFKNNRSFARPLAVALHLARGERPLRSAWRLLSGARRVVMVAAAAPRSLAELAALRCLHVSSRTLRKQEQLTFLSLLAGEYGTCTPKFESRHRMWGELGWKGRWSDPSLKARLASEWDQALAQELAQSSCQFLLRMEISLMLWASGPALGHPHGSKKN